MRKLSIVTGHALTGDVKQIEGNSVIFVAEDGRTMFEITAMPDGRTLDIRAVDHCDVAGTIYGTTIVVEPVRSNVVLVRTKEYE